MIRKTLKILVFATSLLLVSPIVVLTWLEKRLSSAEAVFATSAHLLAIVPGPLGQYLRAAYYFAALDDCSWETHIGFGSLFTHRGARVADYVSTGVYCVIGHAMLGRGVRMASRISIPSGKRQHLDDSGQLSEGTQYDEVAIGADAWIGEGATILSDVGDRSIVSAGAVVIKAIPPDCIAGGNPAKVLKHLDAPRAPAGG